MTDEEWLIEWSNGRIATEEEAKDMIEGYFCFMSKHRRPPHGIFGDCFTRRLLERLMDNPNKDE